MKIQRISVRLEGTKPIMFDRYPGDNQTKLQVHQKTYINADGYLYVPTLNVLSLLTATNTPSVCRQFHGKAGKSIGLAINGNFEIQQDEIVLLGEGNKPLTPTSAQITTRKDVARLAKGLPNPKERPLVSLPWALEFSAEWIENKDCSIDTLRSTVEMGSKIGLGTFRPFFGKYALVKWEVR